jgi:hypothetical protein
VVRQAALVAVQIMIAALVDQEHQGKEMLALVFLAVLQTITVVVAEGVLELLAFQKLQR